MAASRMHRSGVQSSAGCCWRLSPRSSSSRPYSACCTGVVRPRTRWSEANVAVDEKHSQEIDTMLMDDLNKPGSGSTDLPSGTTRKRRSLKLAGLIATVVAVGGVIYGNIVDRVDAEEKLARTTLEAAVPRVTVVCPEAGAPNEEIVLP